MRSREFGTKETLIDALFGCGVLAANAGEWFAVATILSAAVAQAAHVGYTVEAPERARYDRAGAEARAALDAESWAEARRTGGTLAPGQATDLTMTVLAEIGEREPRAASAAFGSLSPRELEILQLLAEGLSNRQIGEALDVSLRTAMRHVTDILTKLGVSSRGAAGATYLRRGQ